MTEPQPLTVREATFALLRELGVSCVFGNPGSTELPMFRDFPRDFRYVLGLQESVVVGMADGYAQARGAVAVVNLHSAVGVGHALGAIFTAFRNQTPLVIIAGQQARSMLPFEPFLYSEQATNLPRPYVKWSCEPARAEDVPAAIARACYTALQAPRGPTFVSVPVDDWERHCQPLAARTVSTVVCADPALLAQAAAALQAARRPVFVAGASVARDGAWEELIALAERHAGAGVGGAALGAQQLSRTASVVRGLPAAGPPGAGRKARRARTWCWCWGRRHLPITSKARAAHVPAGATLVQLTDDPAAAAWSPVGTAIVTDLKLGIAAPVAGCTAAAPQRAGHPAARRAGCRRGAERKLPDAADRRAPAGRHDHRRGGAEQPRRDAGTPADDRAQQLPYLRQRRPGPRPAGRGRRRPSPARTAR